MRFHFDVGPYCWQLVSVVQTAHLDHDEEEEEKAEISDLRSQTELGFQRSDSGEDRS